MNILDEFLNQELEGGTKKVAGHFVGVWAILSLLVTLIIARIVIRDFFLADPDPQLGAILFLLFTGFITIWLFHTAYRLIKDKP